VARTVVECGSCLGGRGRPGGLFARIDVAGRFEQLAAAIEHISREAALAAWKT
jgi:hypothetical protein